MAIRKFESKFNVAAFVTYLASFILMVACYVTYVALPESDTITNSLEFSGEETVRFFVAVPVLGLLSCIAFVAFVLAFRKYLIRLSLDDNKFGDKTIGNAVIRSACYISSVILLALHITSAVFAFILLNDFRELGFVAPITDTIYESYGSFILADCIIHFIFLVLTALKMSGLSLTDSIGALFSDKEKKS